MNERTWRRCVAAVAVLVGIGGSHLRSWGADTRDRTFDQILEDQVRDGFVSYRALKGERGRLDGYVASLGAANLESMSREQQIAFWLNAYNAIVLQTVIDHYPIQQRTRDYPARSIRQIPGAFERLPHRVAGRTLTLDQIEQTVLPAFRDPRVFLALGRGAVGSGRLRSEAYSGDVLDTQLAGGAAECVNRSQCFQVDRLQNRVLINAIFSWRQNDFVEAYAASAAEVFQSRSPVEKAVIAFVSPKLLSTEREVLSQNTFKMEFLPFDWTLNDLSGRAR